MDNLLTIRLARMEDAKKLAEFCEARMGVDNEPVQPEKLLPGVTAPIKDLSKGMYLVATEQHKSELIRTCPNLALTCIAKRKSNTYTHIHIIFYQ